MEEKVMVQLHPNDYWLDHWMDAARWFHLPKQLNPLAPGTYIYYGKDVMWVEEAQVQTMPVVEDNEEDWV